MAERLKPHGVGLIVRTVAEGKSEYEIGQDLDFLIRLWSRIQARAKAAQAPSLIHKDHGLVYRIVRDLFSEDVTRLTVDSRHEYERILELLDVMAPELRSRAGANERPLGPPLGGRRRSKAAGGRDEVA